MQVIAFIDAAFALHFDSKSHIGVMILVGGTVVSPVNLLLPHRTRHSTNMVSPVSPTGLNNQLYCQGKICLN